MDETLKAAAALGWILLPEPEPRGVRVDGRVLRYDPALPADVRAGLLREALRTHGRAPEPEV